MAFHSQLTGADLHEPKGIDTAAASRVYVSNGAGSGSWQPYTGGGGGSSNFSQFNNLWTFTSTAQNPSGVNTPLKINFGSAVGTSESNVQLSGDGDITFNATGVYYIRLAINVGRTTGTGDSELVCFYRIGPQAWDVRRITIKADGDTVLVPFAMQRSMVSGDVITVWIARDGSGDDSGGVMPWTAAAGAVPSIRAAEVQITRLTSP